MKKFNLTNGILILMLIAGLSLLLYPTISEQWNSIHQTRAIAGYSEVVAKMDNKDYSDVWTAATEYNNTLEKRRLGYTLSTAQKEEYDALLTVDNSGVMAYIEIPKIDSYLPIYHGTDEAVLQVAVGHIEWSSLPVGGENSHCVISGHRGLPSAKLFTELDKLVVGDTFMLHVLDETLTYMVDQILIVEPNDVTELEIQEGKDLCTLVTCTPYGVNSHRLLVRGHRTDNAPIEVERRVAADAVLVEPMLVACVIAVPAVLLGIVLIFVFDAANKRQKKHF